jgi:hypothetical protein
LDAAPLVAQHSDLALLSQQAPSFEGEAQEARASEAPASNVVNRRLMIF